MFEIPGAKRIRRNELYSSNPSSRDQSPDNDRTADADAKAKLQAHFHALYGGFTVDSNSPRTAPQPSNSKQRVARSSNDTVDDHASTEDVQPDEKDVSMRNAIREGTAAKGAEDQSYEFRLFSGPAKDSTNSSKLSTSKIILEPDREEVNILGETIIQGDGAFLSQGRDPRVWTRQKADGVRLEQLRFAAITGEDVRRDSRRRNWGLEVPWRVRSIKQKNVPANGLYEKARPIVIEEVQKKKKKAGKKRRIVLRMRVKRVEEENMKKEIESRAKEEADQERKTRKNREKKVKQKMRAKAKAEAAAKQSEGTGLGNAAEVVPVT